MFEFLKVAILKQLEMKHLAPGEVFIRYNETAKNLYFISEGESSVGKATS